MKFLHCLGFEVGSAGQRRDRLVAPQQHGGRQYQDADDKLRQPKIAAVRQHRHGDAHQPGLHSGVQYQHRNDAALAAVEQPDQPMRHWRQRASQRRRPARPEVWAITATAARLGPKPIVIDSAAATTGEPAFSAAPSNPKVQDQPNAKAKNAISAAAERGSLQCMTGSETTTTRPVEGACCVMTVPVHCAVRLDGPPRTAQTRWAHGRSSRSPCASPVACR